MLKSIALLKQKLWNFFLNVIILDYVDFGQNKWIFLLKKNNKHILKCCKFWTDNDTDLCFIAFSSFFEELWIYYKLLFSKLIKTLKYHIKTKIVQSIKMKESTFLTKIYYIWNNDLSRKIVITSVLIKLLTSAFNK